MSNVLSEMKQAVLKVLSVPNLLFSVEESVALKQVLITMMSVLEIHLLLLLILVRQTLLVLQDTTAEMADAVHLKVFVPLDPP